MRKDRRIRRLLRHNYDWDYYFFLEIQRIKLKQMYEYFKQNKYSDNTFVCRDIRICLKLLDLYANPKDENILAVNIKNHKRFKLAKMIEEDLQRQNNPFETVEFSVKNKEIFKKQVNFHFYAKEDLYKQKLLHLYFLIQNYRIETWWD